MRLIEGDLPRQVRKRIRNIGKLVAEQAATNAPVRSGELKGSIKVSLSAKGASVYSTSPYGGAQNVGAWSQGRGPHISRASASRYMNKAVEEKRAEVAREMEAVMQWVETEFAK